MRKGIRSVLLVLLLGAQLDAQQRQLDVTTFVVVGEGLAAGMADFALRDVYQEKSFPAQMAKQMGTIFPQPIIQSPGIGSVPGFPELPVRAPATLQTTVRDDFPPNLFVFNLSVPGFRLSDSLTRRPVRPIVQNDVQQTAINFILGYPTLLLEQDLPLWTQVEYARQMHPTLALIELGYYDMLEAAVKGDVRLLPDIATFRANYSRLLSQLKRPDVDILVMTVPDPMDTAYFSTLEAATRLVSVPPAVLVRLYSLRPDDLITVNGLVAIGNQILARSIQPLPPGSFVAAGTADEVRRRVRALNSEITSLAQQNGALVYDLNALFSRVRNQGITIGSSRITADFLGGFYSLDGYYPGMTGHALIANEVLDLLNRTFGTSFKSVDLVPFLRADPTVQAQSSGAREFTLEELEEFIPDVRKMVEPEGASGAGGSPKKDKPSLEQNTGSESGEKASEGKSQ